MSEEAATPDLNPALELDCRGLNCPLPVLKTKKAITGVEIGEILKVVSTDAGSIADMGAFSRRTGHVLEHQSDGGGEYIFFFRRVK